MAHNVDKLLHKLYYTPGLDSAYGSINRLYRAAKKRGINVKRSFIEKWLLAQDVYTLHKSARKKLTAEPRVHVSGIDEQWSLDLCDMNNIKQYNDGNCYILTVIDVFSKKAWAEPVKNKSGLTTATAFENILKRTKGRKPQQIETDKGKEFYNKEFRKACENHGINHFSTTSSNKASTVERFNRTLKSLLYRYFTANNTYRWLDVLNDILQTYNNRWHRSIRMSPNEVTNENEKLVYKILFAKKPKFGKLMHKGDKVRISKKKHTFEKGYLPNFTEEVFKISKVTSKRPPFQYTLKDLNDELIVGKFAPQELQKVIKDDKSLWVIEKVLQKKLVKSGKTRYLVKWRGFPEHFNSYVNEEDIVNLI